MISYKNGIVKKIMDEFDDVSWVMVDIEGNTEKSINYNHLTGSVKLGDRVVVNTTAVDLSLGTGGQHFIIYNHSNPSKDLSSSKGHIMKVRYTPNQMRFLTMEEEDSPYHDKFINFKSLDNHIVIIASLHSMLAPIASTIKCLNPSSNITYIMTDSGALPIGFSNTVRDLKSKNILNNTITIGHAFGGDYESTNIYTGLIGSKEVLNSDISIVSMGPGIVGTGTKYGFSGIDQGYQIDSVNTLGGRAIVVPRISFKDKRKRHQGISHHSITVLKDIAKTRANIIFPNLNGDESKTINTQITKEGLDKKHNIYFRDGKNIEEYLKKYNLHTTTMGRGISSDYEFFETLGAVGEYVTELI